MPRFFFDGDELAATMMLGHGGGGAAKSPWMDMVAGAIAGVGFRVVRFEFAYMTARRNG
jgi:predicted alpha/beta-hydrolase family hydrolase